jgi:hypothetical protein
MLTPNAALTLATDILSRREQRPVAVRLVETLGSERSRNLVLRAVAESGENTTGIILKTPRAPDYDAAAADGFQRFGTIREWAAVSLLAGAPRDPGEGAAWLGGDAARGLLIFADLGAGLSTMVGPLLQGSAERAEAALSAQAEALGRMHAATSGCRAAHAAALAADFPAASVSPPGRNWVDRVARPATALLGGTLPEDEAALIARHLADPGDWLCLGHGDPCPDNTLLRDGRAILIDYEFAAPAHALFDALYARLAGPTCWCAGRLPDDVLARIEGAWRASVAPAIPAARDDDAFAREAAIVTAAWLFTVLALPWLGGVVMAGDEVWGLASKRGRVLHHLRTTIRATEAACVLPGVRRLAGEWLDRLSAAWPDTAEIGVYPAFAPAAPGHA